MAFFVYFDYKLNFYLQEDCNKKYVLTKYVDSLNKSFMKPSDEPIN